MQTKRGETRSGIGPLMVTLLLLLFPLTAHPGASDDLLRAAKIGEVVKLLVQAKADTNAKDNDGHTAHKDNSDNGHTEIVKLLTAAGAK